jgi:hypothetical protein
MLEVEVFTVFSESYVRSRSIVFTVFSESHVRSRSIHYFQKAMLEVEVFTIFRKPCSKNSEYFYF